MSWIWIIDIKLSQNTKIEDLFGITDINFANDKFKIIESETRFHQALCNDGIKKLIISNFNNASPAVLDKFYEIVDKKQDYISLPRGERKKKENFKLCVYLIKKIKNYHLFY